MAVPTEEAKNPQVVAADITETKEEASDQGKWQCHKCGLYNLSSRFQCFACYASFDKHEIVIPKTMQALIKGEEKEGFSLQHVDVPEPGDGELLVRSFAVGICGSDVILYKWTKDAATIAKVPFTPGHETAGMVVKKGANTRMKVGTRVAIENHLFCGECKLCKEKRGDICLNFSQFGHGKGTIYGGCSEYFVVKEIYCYRLRSGISWQQAALLEPIGVAHNACERVEPNGADECLIIGCGAVGLFAISVAKAMGCKRVIATDIIKSKLEMATKMGADLVINGRETDLKETIMKETNGIGVARLIECSGNVEMTNLSFSLLRKGATIVLVGLPKKPIHIENPLPNVIFKSLTLRTIHGRRIFHTWKESEKLVSSGKVKTDGIVSHTIPLSQFEDGYKALMSGQACKVMFDPTQ